MLPLRSYSGVVWPLIDVIWFCWLAVRVCVLPSVVNLDQLPVETR
jgi:hypothetical protein